MPSFLISNHKETKDCGDHVAFHAAIKNAKHNHASVEALAKQTHKYTQVENLGLLATSFGYSTQKTAKLSCVHSLL